MIISGVSFNAEILDALEQNRLVIFAGAGISMGAPANLMDFTTLAKKIGEGTSIEYSEKEKFPEVYLGKLKNEGVRIYELLAQNLIHEGSLHTELHKNLIKLFSDPEQCRIITTNYDLFFEKAYQELYNKEFKRYVSPALPLGKEFKGLVHLHGALGEDKNGIVLTDDDFGRAYLTEGWARRFLRDVFENNTVLFVGYSHDDTVMKYLARGLPPSNYKRYVLVGNKDEKDEWEHLNVNPIKFQQENSKDFESLYLFFEEFLDLNSRGALDTERKIEELVSSPSEMNEEGESQLRYYLSKEFTTRFFCKYAKDKIWLNWMYKEGFLDVIFKKEMLSDKDLLIISWFSNFCTSEIYKSIQIFTSRTERPNLQTAERIAWALNSVDFSNENQDKKVFNLWLPLLIPFYEFYSNKWDYILDRRLFEILNTSGNTDLLLLFLETLTKPKVKIRKSFPLEVEGYSKKEIYFEVDLEISLHQLKSLIENIKPHKEKIAIRVCEILTKNLEFAYQSNKILGKANSYYDPFSLGRSAIEPHEQDKYPKAIDAVIDFLRDLLEYLIEEDSAYLDGTINDLLNSDSKLLKRIGIHSVTKLKNKSEKEKIELLIKNEWLSDIRVKHETYQLIKKSFPNLHKDEKEFYLKKILSGHKKLFKNVEDVTDEDIVYQNFNLLKWIEKSDPKCKEIQERLHEIHKNYPKFKPKEYLDLTRWTSDATWGEMRKPINKEELLTKKPTQALIYIKESVPKDEFDKRQVLSGVTQAVTEDQDWGISLLEQVIKNEIKDKYLFDSVIYGFEGLSLKKLLSGKLYKLISSDISLEISPDLLSRIIRDKLNSGDELNKTELNIIDLFLDKLWQNSIQIKLSHSTGDWLDKAINHPVGNVSLSWINLLDRASTPNQIERIFEQRLKKKVIKNDTQTRPLGLAILGSNFDFLFYKNSDWIDENLLSLFSYKENSDFEAVWDGWLTWGRLSLDSLNKLKPTYVESIKHLTREDFRDSYRFSDHLSNIIFFTSNNPIDEILIPYTNDCFENKRHELINSIDRKLGSLDPEKLEIHWNKWIKNFIEIRVNSVPKRITQAEYSGILDWIPKFEFLFHEAVETFVKTDPKQLKHSGIFTTLNESELIRNNSDDVMILLNHILSVEIPSYFCHSLNQIYEALKKEEKNVFLFDQLGNHLSKKGCI
ncbi:MAG: DUF4020 domain-containing protein [Balneola sp.]|nr:DUF4020 domain-containing protein [Balneola sp.]